MVSKKCAYCKDTIPQSGTYYIGNKSFCSYSCGDAWNNKKKSKENNKKQSSIGFLNKLFG